MSKFIDGTRIEAAMAVFGKSPEPGAAVLKAMRDAISEDLIEAVSFRLRPLAVKRRGKRARRAAFYEQARMCRLMPRIVSASLQREETPPEWRQDMR